MQLCYPASPSFPSSLIILYTTSSSANSPRSLISIRSTLPPWQISPTSPRFYSPFSRFRTSSVSLGMFLAYPRFRYSSRSTPRCRVQAKKARFALSLELSASTEASTGGVWGNERSCEVRGGGFRERLFHPLPSHSYLSRYKQKRTTSPLFGECSTSSSESSSVEH